MPFFQNPFPQDFDVSWFTGNSVGTSYGQDILKYSVRGHSGRTDEYVSSLSISEFLDLSGDDADSNSHKFLNLNFNVQNNGGWNSLKLDLSTGASDLTKVSLGFIADTLNTNQDFAANFKAHVNNRRLYITSTRKQFDIKFYIQNGGAEELLKFNYLAGVGELPSSMLKYQIASRPAADHHLSALVHLDLDSTVDTNLITNAVDFKMNSLNLSATEKSDWELLDGKTAAFKFKKNTVDDSNRITEQLVYNAGSKVGDPAHLIVFKYDGSNTTPSEELEIPHILVAEDLIVPE